MDDEGLGGSAGSCFFAPQHPVVVARSPGVGSETKSTSDSGRSNFPSDIITSVHVPVEAHLLSVLEQDSINLRASESVATRPDWMVSYHG